MLIAMSQNPDGVENIKLANNAGYLGESLDGMGADNSMYIYPVGSNPQAPVLPNVTGGGGGGGGSASEDARKWIDSIAKGAATVIPLFKKAPKAPSNRGGGGDFNPPEDNTMTYVAIGGAALLGGILLYSMFKKKKK